MKLALLFINFLIFPFDIDINCLNCSNQNSFSVLLITETKGWVHDSIESGIDCHVKTEVHPDNRKRIRIKIKKYS